LLGGAVGDRIQYFGFPQGDTPQELAQDARQRAQEVIYVKVGCGVSAVAEAAGINICLHGVHETGVTTCATNQVGATLTNLDDGNQYMNHLLIEDIVMLPRLALQKGELPVISGPGLGFELDWDAIGRAEEAYRACREK
jgi:L-alanine-DL-glutamate epimerase-like enolase superfamily enzyme